jgi:hypothetical protein
VLLKRIVSLIGKLLEQRVHGPQMLDAGSNFFVQQGLLKNELVRSTLELGIQYSILFTDHISITEGLHEESEFRLANIINAVFWLPMQKGGHVVLQSKHTREAFAGLLFLPTPATPTESSKVLDELQLDLAELGSGNT